MGENLSMLNYIERATEHYRDISVVLPIAYSPVEAFISHVFLVASILQISLRLTYVLFLSC